MDFMAQVQSYLMSHQYESLLKKANFQGGLRAMSKEDVIQMQGEIEGVVADATFRIKRKMVMWCWVIYQGKCACTTFVFWPGDKVTVELTPYDLAKRVLCSALNS